MTSKIDHFASFKKILWTPGWPGLPSSGQFIVPELSIIYISGRSKTIFHQKCSYSDHFDLLKNFRTKYLVLGNVDLKARKPEKKFIKIMNSYPKF